MSTSSTAFLTANTSFPSTRMAYIPYPAAREMIPSPVSVTDKTQYHTRDEIVTCECVVHHVTCQH